MILTIKEGYNKHEGTDLPMFSRTGKSTISQYLQFSQHKSPNSPGSMPKVVAEEGDESGEDDIALGVVTKPRDPNAEM